MTTVAFLLVGIAGGVLLGLAVVFVEGRGPLRNDVRPGRCPKPQPPGWHPCTRHDGHDGPCALWPLGLWPPEIR